MNISTTGLPEGSHTLTAKAYDVAGHTPTTSEGVPVIIDYTAPTLLVSSPIQASFVRGTVQVNATASDNREVTKVEFYDGATLLSRDTTAPYSVSWNTTGVPSGDRKLSARAYDAAGNFKEDYRDVTVDTAAPTVAITSPANGATVSGLSTTIQANATDTQRRDAGGVLRRQHAHRHGHDGALQRELEHPGGDRGLAHADGSRHRLGRQRHDVQAGRGDGPVVRPTGIDAALHSGPHTLEGFLGLRGLHRARPRLRGRGRQHRYSGALRPWHR